MSIKKVEFLNMGKIILFLTGAALILATSTADAARFRIRDCPNTALIDLNWAVDFIDNNLDAILASSTLNSSYQVRIREHWRTTTIKCQGSGHCDNNPNTRGYQITANRVHLCWDNLLAAHGLNRCSLVGIIMHEKAHEAHVPKSDQHNDRHNYSFEVNIDPVYQFGNAAFNYCHTTASAASPRSFNSSGLLGLGTTGDLAIGDYCDRNNQCQGDQCRWGVCVCDEDSDCASGYICKKSGKNKCVRAQLPLGAGCDINDQCQSGQCRWGECVCDDDSDCASGYICKKSGKNKCVRAQLPLGASCDVNDQCQSGQCRWGNCVCNDDSDCPSNHRCKKGGKNECIRVGGNIGEICNKNDDCITGRCDRDICVCKTDEDCRSAFGPNMRCRKLGQNHCQRTNLSQGERCHKDSDCQSNNCKGLGSRRTCR